MSDDVEFDPEQTIEEQAARIALSDMDGLARKAREMRGQPFGLPHLTPDQELWAWTHYDDTVDHHALLAQGLPPSEVAAKKFPLQQRMMEQAGTSFDEQNAYAQRMTARALSAYQSGRLPKPPARGPQTLAGRPMTPPVASQQPAAPPALPALPAPPVAPDPTMTQGG